MTASRVQRALEQAGCGPKVVMKMRPTLTDVERYLDELGQEREHVRWLLEDINGIEDGPEIDEAVEKSLHAN